MEIGVVLNCSQEFRREAKYVFDTMFETLGVPYTVYPADTAVGRVERPACDVLFYYGGEDDPRRSGDGFLVKIFCEDYDAIWRRTDSQIRATRVSGTRGMPTGHILIGQSGSPQSDSRALLIDAFDEKPLVSFLEQTCCIDILFDMIASAFYLLSGREERYAGDAPQDAPARDHRSRESSILEEPVVNNYLEIVLNLLILAATTRGGVLLQKWYWPRANEFAVFLCHDVDTATRRPSRARAVDGVGQILRLKPGAAFSHVARMLRPGRRGKAPLWDFSEWIRLETAHSFSSSFYFLAVSAGFPRHLARDERLHAVMHELKQSGFEIGLRASEGVRGDPSRLRLEKQLLEDALESKVTGLHKYCAGSSTRENDLAGEGSGFMYDSLRVPDGRIGYRAGLAFPFFAYIPQERQASRVLEIPLVIEDDALFKEEPSVVAAFERVAGIMRRISRYHALLSLLWHSSPRHTDDFSARWRVYCEVLNRLDGKWVFNDTGANLAKWWLEREAVRVSRFAKSEDGLEWTITTARGIRHLTLKLYPGLPDYEVGVSGVTYFVSRTRSSVTVQLQTIEPEKEVVIAVRRK